MRIGEMAVVGTTTNAKVAFIEAVCDEVEVQNDALTFGRILVNDQLVLHLYGVDYVEEDVRPAWDLVSKKLLGYVVLFDWNGQEGLASANGIIDSIARRYNVPIVVVGNVADTASDVPSQLVDVELSLSDQCRFVLCDVTNPASVKNALIILVNSVLEQLK